MAPGRAVASALRRLFLPAYLGSVKGNEFHHEDRYMARVNDDTIFASGMPKWAVRVVPLSICNSTDFACHHHMLQYSSRESNGASIPEN
jgi:hypothetical protein